ncbi:MAG: TIGR04086 family membrane protein [Limnochordia bacterium]|nr:TIGR04086 family membrane protein [Limnochordia bacterium]
MAKKNDTEGSRLYLDPVALLQGFILAQVLLLLLTIVLATLVYFSSWQASLGLLAALAHLGVLGGSVVAGWRCHKRAWLHGVVVGVAAFLVLSWLGYGDSPFVTWAWWNALLKMTMVAMLGGIFGGLFST